MSNAEKNVCDILRDTWFSLITLLNNLKDIPRKVLTQIRQLVQKLKNIVDDALVKYAKEIADLIKSYLDLRKIDSSKARKSFCSLLYSCMPAVNKLIEFGVIPKALADEIFGPNPVKQETLESFGIYGVTINSNFELFEYIACRLSVTTLLNNYIDNMINSLLVYLQQFEKYLDLDFWLNNHYIGRLIQRKIAEYEALMSYILQIINDDVEPFMDCAFATCDFAVSTKNFLDDFGDKMDCEREPPKSITSLAATWKVSREKITKAFSDSLEDTKEIFAQISQDAQNSKDNFDAAKAEIKKDNKNSELEGVKTSDTTNITTSTSTKINRPVIVRYLTDEGIA